MRMQFELAPYSERRHRAADLTQLTRRVKFEQRDLLAHARLNQQLECAVEQEEHRARPRMLGEQVYQGLLLEARLDHGAMRQECADAVSDRERGRKRAAAEILADSHQHR